MITWTQVAGSFAFSQGTINPAHIYVRSESETLDSLEKSLASDGLRCQLEPEFEEHDAIEVTTPQLAEIAVDRITVTRASQRAVIKLRKMKRKEIVAKVRPVIETIATPVPAPELAETESEPSSDEVASPFTVEFSEGVIHIEAETILEPFSDVDIFLTATPLTEPEPKFEVTQTEPENVVKPSPCSSRPSVEPATLPVPFLRPPFEKL